MKRVQCENPKNAMGYRPLFDMRTLGTMIIAIIGIVSFALPVRSAGPANVPNPTVIGPIPAIAPPGDPSHNYPFFSTTADLASYGYARSGGVRNREALISGLVLSRAASGREGWSCWITRAEQGCLPSGI